MLCEALSCDQGWALWEWVELSRSKRATWETKELEIENYLSNRFDWKWTEVSVLTRSDLARYVTCGVGWRWMKTMEASWSVWKLIWESWKGNFSRVFAYRGFFRMKMTNYIFYMNNIWLQISWCLPWTEKLSWVISQHLPSFVQTIKLPALKIILSSWHFFIDWFITSWKER